jgi:hypothetical protein
MLFFSISEYGCISLGFSKALKPAALLEVPLESGPVQIRKARLGVSPHLWDGVLTRRFIHMRETRNPNWWNTQHESAWNRVKAAFKRDWDQTKHDFGAHRPDTDQNVGDTVKQAAGKEPIPPRGMPTYEDTEDAYRFGYGARFEYGKRFNRWDDQLEAQLKQDWNETYRGREWAGSRDSIRRAWEYEDRQNLRNAA